MLRDLLALCWQLPRRSEYVCSMQARVQHSEIYTSRASDGQCACGIMECGATTLLDLVADLACAGNKLLGVALFSGRLAGTDTAPPLPAQRTSHTIVQRLVGDAGSLVAGHVVNQSLADRSYIEAAHVLIGLDTWQGCTRWPQTNFGGPWIPAISSSCSATSFLSTATTRLRQSWQRMTTGSGHQSRRWRP